MNLFTKQEQTYRYKKQTYGYQRGNVAGRKNQALRMNIRIHTTAYKVDNPQGPTV